MTAASRRHALVAALAAILALSACSDDADDGSGNSADASNNGGDDAQDDAGADDSGADTAPDSAPDALDDAATDVPDTGPVAWPVDETPLPEGPWSIDASGPYTVGFRTLEATYVPDGMSEPRSIVISLWYPSRQLTGPAPVYSNLVIRDGEGVKVFQDARLALDAPAPLLVFSMGHTGFAEQSFFMTEFFASHGWVVAAPTHTGNTIFDIGVPRPPQMFEWRPQDLRVTLDTLQSLPGDDPLAGMTTDDIMLSGHSYGGYTTMAAAGAAFDVDGNIADCGRLGDDDDCAYTAAAAERYRAGFGDPRFRAFVPMAAGNSSVFGADGASAITAPVLLMTALLDASVREATEGDRYWAQLTLPTAVRVQFLTGAHHTFSNSCDLAPGAFLNDGCADSFIPAATAHGIINAYAMAWARKHLLGSDAHDDLLDGTVSLHNDSQVYTR